MKIGDKVRVVVEMMVTSVHEQQKPDYSFVCGNVMLGGEFERTNGTKGQCSAYISGVPIKFTEVL